MSGTRKTISIVAIGIVLAAGLIAAVSLLQAGGLLPAISTSTPGNSSGSTVVTTTSSSTTITSLTTATSSQSTGSANTGGPAGSGTLILQLHDPPHVPPGVTSLFVSYTDIWIGSSSPKAWVDLKQSGTIDLMSLVNFTETIANAKIPNGTYDLVVMNISSAMVTSNSKNYTAALPSNQLSVPILGGLKVSNSGIAGAVIDISPTVLEYNVYSSSGVPTTSFAVVPSASAYVIPSSSLNQNSGQIGHRDDVQSQDWLLQKINDTGAQTSFTISSATITNSSFIVIVKNTGNRSLVIQSVFLEPYQNSSRTGSRSGDSEGDLNIGSSILFTVLKNGSMTPYFGSDSRESSLKLAGYNLSAHSQAVFSYLGPLPAVFQNQNGGNGGNDSSVLMTTQTSRTTSEGGDNLHSAGSALSYQAAD